MGQEVHCAGQRGWSERRSRCVSPCSTVTSECQRLTWLYRAPAAAAPAAAKGAVQPKAAPAAAGGWKGRSPPATNSNAPSATSSPVNSPALKRHAPSKAAPVTAPAPESEPVPEPPAPAPAPVAVAPVAAKTPAKAAGTKRCLNGCTQLALRKCWAFTYPTATPSSCSQDYWGLSGHQGSSSGAQGSGPSSRRCPCRWAPFAFLLC